MQSRSAKYPTRGNENLYFIRQPLRRAIVYIPGNAGQGYNAQLTTGLCVHVYSTLSTSTVRTSDY